MEYLRVRNWEKYQGTAGLNVDYVRVSTKILTDAEFHSLSTVDRLTFLFCLCYAGIHSNKIPNDSSMLGRIFLLDDVDIIAIVDAGFLEPWDEKLHNDMIRKYLEHNDKRKKQWRESKQRIRAEKSPVHKCPPMSTLETETETETETENITEAKASGGNGLNGHVPVTQIVELWHEMMPELPRLKKLTSARAAAIRQRHKEDMHDMETWRDYFTFIRQSPFLMGRSPPSPGRTSHFEASLDWVCKAENYAKIYERKFHERKA